MTETTQTPTELTTLGNFVRDFAMKKSILSADIIKMKQELYQTEFYQGILKKEQELRELEQKETETKNHIMEQMIKFDIKSVDFTHQKFTIKSNPGSISIKDEKLVPADFVKEKIELVIDKKALKEAVENGLVIEGVEIKKSQSLLITPR